MPGGNVDVKARASASSNLVRNAEKLSRRTGLFLLLMVEAERKIRLWGNAESAETVGDKPLYINDLSICLWRKFPIDKCLNC